jgi:hypothetical protein
MSKACLLCLEMYRSCMIYSVQQNAEEYIFVIQKACKHVVTNCSKNYRCEK